MTTVAYQPPAAVTTIDGETREVTRTWPDGSWSCPFCSAANGPDIHVGPWDGPCANPGCIVGGAGTAERVAEIRLRRAQEAERASQRAWLHKLQEEERTTRQESRQAAVDAFRAEAQDRGYCLECWGRSTQWGMWLDRAKKVRHRAPENCPSVRRRRS